MNEPKLIFQGNVLVYLQGRNALFPFDIRKPDQMKYRLGSRKSRLFVKDHREKSLQAAKKMLSGDKDIIFKDYFNIHAYVEILKSYKGIIIEINEPKEKSDKQILWMGVLHEKKMPIHRMIWHILKPVDEVITAFAAIVED